MENNMNCMDNSPARRFLLEVAGAGRAKIMPRALRIEYPDGRCSKNDNEPTHQTQLGLV